MAKKLRTLLKWRKTTHYSEILETSDLDQMVKQQITFDCKIFPWSCKIMLCPEHSFVELSKMNPQSLKIFTMVSKTRKICLFVSFFDFIVVNFVFFFFEKHIECAHIYMDKMIILNQVKVSILYSLYITSCKNIFQSSHLNHSLTL